MIQNYFTNFTSYLKTRRITRSMKKGIEANYIEKPIDILAPQLVSTKTTQSVKNPVKKVQV